MDFIKGITEVHEEDPGITPGSQGRDKDSVDAHGKHLRSSDS